MWFDLRSYMPNKNKLEQNFKEKENQFGINLLVQLIKRITTLESLIDGSDNKTFLK
jgi:hypothetical protein